MSGAAGEIRALLGHYGERMDDGDFAGVGRLFEHATWRNGAAPDTVVASGAAEIAALLERSIRLYDGRPLEQHLTTNSIVDVDDANLTATARSAFVVFMAAPAFPLQPTGAGRYHDRFRRTDRGWEFADRLFLQDLRGDLSAHHKG